MVLFFLVEILLHPPYPTNTISTAPVTLVKYGWCHVKTNMSHFEHKIYVTNCHDKNDIKGIQHFHLRL